MATPIKVARIEAYISQQEMVEKRAFMYRHTLN